VATAFGLCAPKLGEQGPVLLAIMAFGLVWGLGYVLSPAMRRQDVAPLRRPKRRWRKGEPLRRAPITERLRRKDAVEAAQRMDWGGGGG
jgi:hypothetical protein